MATAQEEFIKIQGNFDRPIPGMSLTNSPDTPANWEKPPKYVSVYEASEYIFSKIIEPNRYVSLMESIDEGIPIMDITQAIVFNEYYNGKFNPDLMLMMLEPVAYMLIALAEKLDLNIVIDNEEEDDSITEDDKLAELRNKIAGDVKLGTANLPTEIQEQIEELPETLAEARSLLAAPEEGIE